MVHIIAVFKSNNRNLCLDCTTAPSDSPFSGSLFTFSHSSAFGSSSIFTLLIQEHVLQVKWKKISVTRFTGTFRVCQVPNLIATEVTAMTGADALTCCPRNLPMLAPGRFAVNYWSLFRCLGSIYFQHDHANNIHIFIILVSIFEREISQNYSYFLQYFCKVSLCLGSRVIKTILTFVGHFARVEVILTVDAQREVARRRVLKYTYLYIHIYLPPGKA